MGHPANTRGAPKASSDDMTGAPVTIRVGGPGSLARRSDEDHGQAFLAGLF